MSRGTRGQKIFELGTRPMVTFAIATTSVSQGRKQRMQVAGFVVVDGARTHIHRHLQRTAGVMVGLHPDESIPKQHRAAERDVGNRLAEVVRMKAEIRGDDELLAQEKIPERIIKIFAREIELREAAVKKIKDQQLLPTTPFAEKVLEGLMSSAPASATEEDVRVFIASRREAVEQELNGAGGPAELLAKAEQRLAALRMEKPETVAYAVSGF